MRLTSAAEEAAARKLASELIIQQRAIEIASLCRFCLGTNWRNCSSCDGEGTSLVRGAFSGRYFLGRCPNCHGFGLVECSCRKH